MNIIIIGDSILDIYYESSCNRLAPEALIPVFKNESMYYRLGGSSNIALNLKSLGCNPILISICGDDDNYNKFINIINNYNIENYIIKDNMRKTTSKNRIICNNIIYSRFDIEDTFDINLNIENKIIQYIINLNNTKKIDGIILSDYNKGLLTENLCKNIIDFSNKNNILTFIDPKVNNINKYKNCTLFKPNLLESSLISDKENINERIVNIYEKINCKIVLITLGKDGMIYYDGSNIKKIFHKKEINCIDATGAGDNIISIFSYYYLLTNNLDKTIELSNFIGSKAVKKIGNYIITLDDIIEFENINNLNIISKNLNLENLFKIKDYYNNKKIVFTNGCFDIIHTAHIKLLKFCKSQGDILIVGLNSDKSIKNIKGNNRPINNENDRIEFLLLLDFIDHVILFEEDTPYNIISILKPDILVKGGDYKKDDIIGKEFTNEIIIYDYINNKSTTNIINKIKYIDNK
jgi:D-beta-D-heptose 7-phosphate kinase/D-beta-D-heptose 1-phosphate adenosyltransferase